MATIEHRITCRCVKPGVKTYVIDCEVVAYDREKDKILPFQVGLTLEWSLSLRKFDVVAELLKLVRLLSWYSK